MPARKRGKTTRQVLPDDSDSEEASNSQPARKKVRWEPSTEGTEGVTELHDSEEEEVIEDKVSG